jgi:hypothetical protein
VNGNVLEIPYADVPFTYKYKKPREEGWVFVV